jgi:hypothetical protein
MAGEGVAEQLSGGAVQPPPVGLVDSHGYE